MKKKSKQRQNSRLMLSEDLDNYMYYKTMGARPRFKAGVLPHIFSCQEGGTIAQHVGNLRKPTKRLHVNEPAVPSSSVVQEPSVMEDPLEVEHPLLESCENPLYLVKTELICQEEDGSSDAGGSEKESQLAAPYSLMGSNIKAEPPDIQHEDAVGTHQDFHWTSPDCGNVEDHKPLQKHCAVADIGKHSSTQPPHGGWGLCVEGGLPCPRDVWVDQLSPGCQDPDVKNAVTPGCSWGPSNTDTSLWVEDTGAVETELGEELESADAGCSTEDFECSMCHMQFEEKKLLKRHIKMHKEEGKLCCKLCNKQFGLLSNLSRHYSAHTHEKPFRCQVCSKKFTRASYLTLHNRIHTGEKPFQCDFCSKRFTASSYLFLHSRMHTDDKPFQCEVCKTRFTTKHGMTRHSMTHTGEKPFQCEVCNKQFITSSDLTRHSRMHTGEKPFPCETCSKRFSTSSNLTQHNRTHTGEKPSNAV